MIQKPIDVLQQYPIRKDRKQKQNFRNDVCFYLDSMGYSCSFEKGSLGSTNLVAGDPERASILVTAHYDTCVRLPFPNFITPCNFAVYLLYQILISVLLLLPFFAALYFLPLIIHDYWLSYWLALLILYVTLFLLLAGPANKNNANDNTSGVVTVLEIAAALPKEHRDNVCFVLFDLEESGLIGSMSYRSKHKKASEHQTVLNLDCVGEGDDLVFFPSGKVRKNGPVISRLRTLSGSCGDKRVSVAEKGFNIYPSDQSNFPLGVGICALKRGAVGLYMDRIHTNKDVILEMENVNILRDKLINYIISAAEERN